MVSFSLPFNSHNHTQNCCVDFILPVVSLLFNKEHVVNANYGWSTVICLEKHMDTLSSDYWSVTCFREP